MRVSSEREKTVETFRNQSLRDDPSARGKEIFEIKPVIIGGSPDDPANKTLLGRDEHIEAVVYWNRLIKQLREKQRAP